MKDDSRLVDGTYRGYRVSVKLIRKGLKQYNPRKVHRPEEVYDFFKDLDSLDREVFYTLHLDAKNHIVSCEEVSKGTISSSMVGPREVYKAAILSSASSIIVAHNHPSGDPNPSVNDIRMADRLYQSGEILGIPLNDSVIIGNGEYYSMKEKREL